MKLANEGISTKRVLFWSTAGSIAAAASSFLLLMIVTRVMGADASGNYSIGYSIAQLMWTIGVFEETTYFATDARGRFTSEQYFAFKILSTALMAVVSVVYTLSFGYPAEKCLLTLWLCAFRGVDAFGLYYYAAFQKAGRLDLSGFYSTWEMVLSTVAFGVVLVLTRDVVLAVIVATVVEALWIAVYNNVRLRAVAPIQGPDFSPVAMRSLLVELLPLFLSSFVQIYLSNIPKYAIDAICAPEVQTLYNVIFMPSFVINPFMLFVMRPLLTPLSESWLKGEVAEFRRIIRKLVLAVAGMTVVVVGLASLLCVPVLELVFSIDLKGSLPALLVVLLGGGIASAANVLYYAIVILRRQRAILLAYVAAVASATLAAAPLVSAFGLLGAGMTYCVSVLALLVVYAIVYLLGVRGK